MTPIALAHDRASGRFVFGDGAGRKLVIVDERMHFVVDLVREASAGFYDIAAFEIDPRRGDLWVVERRAGDRRHRAPPRADGVGAPTRPARSA